MSVSKAILSGNFEDLESAIEGKTNEVFSTLLFDSYDDKRIEEMLFLEAFNWIDELMPNMNMIYHSGAHLGYNDLVSGPKKVIGEEISNNEYNQYMCQYGEQLNSIVKNVKTIKVDNNLLSLLDYIKENYPKFIHEKRFEFGKIAFVLNERSSSDFEIKYSGRTIMRYISSQPSHYYFRFQYTFHSDYIMGDSTRGYILTEENKLRSEEVSYNYPTNPKPIEKSLLLKRLCERHASNEHIVSSMKKKLEIESLYYHMKDLSVEDSKLTQEINAKREQLNALNEDICSRKIELRLIENRIIDVQNELEASIKHLKSFEISNEIEYENTFKTFQLNNNIFSSVNTFMNITFRMLMI